jgi:hypothetical protein
VIIFRNMNAESLLSRRNLLAAAGLCLAIPSNIGAIDSLVKFKARTLDGEMFSTESVEGKVVLVEFWRLGVLTAGAMRRRLTDYFTSFKIRDSWSSPLMLQSLRRP